jgi:di/tricarboxylate transporter
MQRGDFFNHGAPFTIVVLSVSVLRVPVALPF